MSKRSNQKRMEEVIKAYWAVGTALRHPKAQSMTTSDALRLLNQSDRLNPVSEELRLSSDMHTLRYDIIEGNTKWRKHENPEVQRLASILHMRR